MTATALPAVALLLAAAVWLLVPAPAEGRAARLAGATHRDRLARWRSRAAALAGRWGMGPASRRRRAAERMRVVRALAALAAELEAGQPPREALRRASGEPAAWPRAVAALRLDGDIASALEADAGTRPALAQLAACWRVAAEAGTGLAPAVIRLAESARTAEDARVDLEGQLAGPRATARLLSGLPAIGIAFGLLLGSDPLGWLLGTGAGRLCLAVGLLLTAIGAGWTGRIAASVERLL